MFAGIDPSRIERLDSRAATFENPAGERGAGGKAFSGRKGAPSRILAAGETVVLADIRGTGTVRHIWMTFPPSRPETLRSLTLEVFYGNASEPSISVPVLDFFGLPHGRTVAYFSALTAVQEGRGYNAYFPMPFGDGIRIEFRNGNRHRVVLYYQVDFTLEETVPADAGYLHVAFRRENPTVLRRDFVIAEGLRGPGRFLGSAVGIRLIDPCDWYGEGEMKVFRDGDTEFPTICGTGLEDYVGSAWGMGAHTALYGGVPLDVRAPGTRGAPDFVGFYRWHVPDPIIFEREMRVTIQQIGAVTFREGQEEEFARYSVTNPAAGSGWAMAPAPGAIAQGIAERVDDFCAAAFVYCLEPQAVPRVDLAGAVADIGRREYESRCRSSECSAVRADRARPGQSLSPTGPWAGPVDQSRCSRGVACSRRRTGTNSAARVRASSSSDLRSAAPRRVIHRATHSTVKNAAAA